jgi:hypothetical chaperone protein
MHKFSCGIDFGTSNSSVAVADSTSVNLIPLEDSRVTMPSAVFFPKGELSVYGRAAVQMFMNNREGRFMRSLKRILGTSLMKHGTSINGKPFTFERIIALYLKSLKDKTSSVLQHDIEDVVIGRPVHFADKDITADKRAQLELEGIAKLIGYRNVDFQFEPIAAAFAHEINVTGEKLAIVADLGGGTSDFTIIRLSRNYIRKHDRSADILANAGVRIGGNDFDKLLSLAAIMTELGYLSTYGKKNLQVPMKYYHDLAEWSKVNFLYTPKVLSQIRQYLVESHDKKRLERLLFLLEEERGHMVLSTAEEGKIELTSVENYLAPFQFMETDFFIPMSRSVFENAISSDVGKIMKAASECLIKAGVKSSEIELVILTGGSTELPVIQDSFRKSFPLARIADENKLSSVGLGLAYDAQRKFM